MPVVVEHFLERLDGSFVDVRNGPCSSPPVRLVADSSRVRRGYPRCVRFAECWQFEDAPARDPILTMCRTPSLRRAASSIVSEPMTLPASTQSVNATMRCRRSRRAGASWPRKSRRRSLEICPTFTLSSNNGHPGVASQRRLGFADRTSEAAGGPGPEHGSNPANVVFQCVDLARKAGTRVVKERHIDRHGLCLMAVTDCATPLSASRKSSAVRPRIGRLPRRTDTSTETRSVWARKVARSCWTAELATEIPTDRTTTPVIEAYAVMGGSGRASRRPVAAGSDSLQDQTRARDPPAGNGPRTMHRGVHTLQSASD